MSRGNQRDKARQKNLKKQEESRKKSTADKKTGNKGMTLEERRHRDADIMRKKQEKNKGTDPAGSAVAEK
ncbi:Hypothetical predicted protein [Octopus vulgaris]|uniref:Small EDRK-rich factor-like N-terminal domain-containing protein n=1 Tax=Octopus vulgaris TaxID=6645 RepID=A0AA36FB96_OCTVU|nr:Hypothetical predicted protein [Octopus vulgaris]